MNKFIRIIFVITLSLSSAYTHAQSFDNFFSESEKTNKKSDTKQNDLKTTILSNSLKYDTSNKKTIFTGNVIVSRGSLKVTADTLEIVDDGSGSQSGTATAKNKVELFTEKSDSHEILQGFAKVAYFNGATETITLKGDATITRSYCGTIIDSISSDEIIFDNKSKVYQATSKSQQARVRTIFQTKPIKCGKNG